MSDPKPEAGTEPAGADAPKYVTIEDVKTLLDKRDKTILSKFDAGLGELKALLAAKPAEPEVKGPEPGDKAAPTEESLAIRSLKRQLEETNARVKAADDARAAEAAKNADTLMRQKLNETLVENGVDSKIVKQVVMLLVDGEKRVRLSDDGEIVFHDPTGEVDLTTGVKAWLKGDDAQRFLPPRGTSGSGDRPAPKGSPGAKPGKGPYAGMTYEELAVKFRDALTGPGSIAIG